MQNMLPTMEAMKQMVPTIDSMKQMLPTMDTVIQQLPTVDTMMESFRSFQEIFQGDDATAFEVLWRVDNFGHCHLQNGEKMRSPVFSLGGKADCYFDLYPKGKTEGSILDVKLRKCTHSYNPTVLFFSIASAKDVGLDGVWETLTRPDSNLTIATLSVKDSEGVRQHPDMLAPDGSLIIRCVVKHRGGSDPQDIFMRSSFVTRNFSSVLQFKDFNDRTQDRTLPDMKNLISDSNDSFTVYLFLIPSDDMVKVQFWSRGAITHNQYVTCKVLAVDSKGVPLSLSKNGGLFTEKSTNKDWVSRHPFAFDFFMDNKESLLPGNTLTLMVELTHTYKTCSGEVRYGPKTIKTEAVTTPGSLRSDLERFMLEDSSSCDLDLKIGPDSVVPVHKSILRARSSVFKAMLDHDTLEKACNAVAVPDLDADTLGRMVRFMYTDTVTDLTWSAAVHLYYAADKYDLGLLRNRCREFLAENVNETNVCEALVLADMHDDHVLRRSARYFVFAQKSTLVDGEQWKNFEQNYPSLAMDLLRDLYCKAKDQVPKKE